MGTINDRLKELMDRERLSQKEFGDILGTSQQRIGAYISGAKIPHNIIESIYRKYPNDFMWLISGENSNNGNDDYRICKKCEEKERELEELKKKYLDLLERHVALSENIVDQTRRSMDAIKRAREERKRQGKGVVW